MIANINAYKFTINHLTSLNHNLHKSPSFFKNLSFGTCHYGEKLKWSLKCETTDSSNGGSEVLATEEEEERGKRKVFSNVIEEREVLCEVEVVSWRERRIKAEISVYSDIQSVWDVLTDYDRLAEFIPNLVSCVDVIEMNDVMNNSDEFLIVCEGREGSTLGDKDRFFGEGHSGKYSICSDRFAKCIPSFVSCKRVPCPHPGGIWLEQRGLQRALYWKIEALVILNLREFLNSEDERQIHFSLVEGDFEKFEGKWSLKSGIRSQETTLSYEVTVVPRLKIPAIILEKVIGAELPVNLLAVARRAERR